MEISLTDDTSGYVFSFEVKGGIDPHLDSSKKDYWLQSGRESGCTADQPSTNTIHVVTPAGDDGGREYIFVFYPYVTVSPAVEKTSGTALAGNATLRVKDYEITTSLWAGQKGFKYY